MAKRERKIRLAIENLLSQRTQKLRKWPLLCFSNFLVSNIFTDKGRGGPGWEGVSHNPLENIGSQCRKNS